MVDNVFLLNLSIYLKDIFSSMNKMYVYFCVFHVFFTNSHFLNIIFEDEAPKAYLKELYILKNFLFLMHFTHRMVVHDYNMNYI